jgi:hypothetical protein
MVETKVVEKKTLFMFKDFFFSENHAIHEIMWKNMVEPDIPKVAIIRCAKKM